MDAHADAGLPGVTLAGLSAARQRRWRKDTSSLVWPLPPEQPRIRFVAEYHGQGDLGKGNDLKKALLGKEQAGLVLENLTV